MQFTIVLALVCSVQGLQQQSLSPGFNLVDEDAKELFDDKDREVGGEEGQTEFGMAAEELMARMSVSPELSPTDFKDKSNRTTKTISHQVIFYASVLVFAVVIAAIYSSRGLLQSFAICAYVISLTLMSISIRNVFVSYSFNYPQFMVVIHSISTGTVGAIILKHREMTGGKKIEYPTMNTLVKGLLPVAMSFALSLGLSNLGLLYANTHFYEMMGTFQIMAVVGLASMLGKPFNAKFSMPLIVCTVGLVAVAFGEMRFNMLGAVFVLGGVVVRASKVQLQSMLLDPNQMTQHFDAIELTTWTAVLTTFIMLAWSAASEGMAPWTDIFDIGTMVAVGATCVAAIVLNFCSLIVMKDVGPVAQQLIGQMKGVLACIGGWAAFGEIITLQQIIGYFVVIGGIVWYNHIDMQIKTEARADMAKMLNADQRVEA